MTLPANPYFFSSLINFSLPKKIHNYFKVKYVLAGKAIYPYMLPLCLYTTSFVLLVPFIAKFSCSVSISLIALAEQEEEN